MTCDDGRVGYQTYISEGMQALPRKHQKLQRSMGRYPKSFFFFCFVYSKHNMVQYIHHFHMHTLLLLMKWCMGHTWEISWPKHLTFCTINVMSTIKISVISGETPWIWLVKWAVALPSHLYPQFACLHGITASTIILGGWEHWVLLSCCLKNTGRRAITYLKCPNDRTVIFSLWLQQIV